MSTGNVFSEVDLTGHKTTLISGTNGSGKSTLLDAVVYALYGKPFRKINKPLLINTINNKDCLVEIEFKIGRYSYFIRRGQRPNIFEIYKDGQLINQDAASRDYQSYLEEQILKINMKSFTQIVILGSATYVPFMELPQGSRREVIEDLLDIQVFSTMNNLLKEKISASKESIANAKRDIEILSAKIESAEKHNASIKRVRETEVEKIKDRVSDLLSQIETDNLQITSVQSDIEQLIPLIGDKKKIAEKNKKLMHINADLNARRRAVDKELTFYHDHDNCPTCKQKIEHKAEFIKTNVDALVEIDEGLLKMKSVIKGIEESLSQIETVEKELQQRNNKIGELRASIKLKKSQLKQFKDDLESAKKEMEEIDLSEITHYNEQLAKTNENHETLVNDREILGVVASMLKDGGIKTRIIRQYIPIMNKLINKYLAMFDLFVDFQLDENFNEVIKSRFRDTFAYASFSEGEKLRINLAILLTWRAVSKMRNSISTNLLIMDEVFDSSADAAGVESLIEVLHNLSNNDNVYVISHRGETFGDKFQHHIKFRKVKEFSEVAA